MTPSLSPRAAAAALAMALAAAPAAQAADAQAQLQITGWQLQASPGLTLSWQPAAEYQAGLAEAREAGGLGGNQLAETGAGSWQALALNVGTGHAGSRVALGLDGLASLSAQADRFAYGAYAQPHSASGWVQRAGQFALSGAGQVTLTLDYTLAVAAPLGDGIDTQALAGLTLWAGNLGTGVDRNADIGLASYEQAGGAASRSGQLQWVLDFDAANTVGYVDLRLNVDASAIAAVPEPASALLGLAGLLVLAGVQAARRRAAGGPPGDGR